MNEKQLYFKKGRRYYPFESDHSPPKNLYFKDVNGEFVELNYNTAQWFNGFPSEGVWLVGKTDYSKYLTKIGGFDTTPARLSLEVIREDFLKALNLTIEKSHKHPMSANEIATETFDEICRLNPTEINESQSLDDRLILMYTNYIFKTTNSQASKKQIESFKDNSLSGIKHYIKRGHEPKNAFEKIIYGHTR